MRHVPIEELLQAIFSDRDGAKDKSRLDRAHKVAARRRGARRMAYIDKNGAAKWTPIKTRFLAVLGSKCWYTEAELVGGPLTIDHYRPKCDYWFLAFNAENYRVACPFSNSPKYNEEHGCAGGKGDEFPLLDPTNKAKDVRSVKRERPVILDPCNPRDCELVAFQPDGRPVVHPEYLSDPVVLGRVEKSKLLLNLDHPDFNSKRARLCEDIAKDVKVFEELAAGAEGRQIIVARLKERISVNAPFSSAARFYLSIHRDRDWVEEILSGT